MLQEAKTDDQAHGNERPPIAGEAMK